MEGIGSSTCSFCRLPKKENNKNKKLPGSQKSDLWLGSKAGGPNYSGKSLKLKKKGDFTLGPVWRVHLGNVC